MQAPDAQRNDQGFYQLPTTTKAVALCLPNFTLATAAAPPAGGGVAAGGLQWVCRLIMQTCILLDQFISILFAMVTLARTVVSIPCCSPVKVISGS